MISTLPAYRNLSGLNGSLEVQNSAAKVMQISGTIGAISASVPALQPVAAIAGVVAGLAGLVTRVAGKTGAALAQTEAVNAQMRVDILQVDAENQKLSNLINKTNASITNLNGICIFNCKEKASLSTAQKEGTVLQQELEGKLKLSAELSQRALETVERLAGLKTEKNLLLWGGGIALATGVAYLIYKLSQS